MSRDIFISYSSRDSKVAEQVLAKLEDSNISCWIAPRDVTPGTSYGEALVNAIEDCSLFLILLSSNSNSSQQVLREVERAVSKGITIIPFRLEDIVLSRSLQYFLSASHWLDASAPPLKQHLEKLATTVKALLAGTGRDPHSLESLKNHRAFPFGFSSTTVTLAAVGIVILSYVGYRSLGTHPAHSPIRSIAILPLENKGSMKNSEDYFAEGLTDQLSKEISRYPLIRTLPFVAVNYAINHKPPTAEINKTLGVDAVVKGNISKKDDILSISIEIVDVRTNETWSLHDNRLTSDVFGMIDTVVNMIVAKLDLPRDNQRPKELNKYHRTGFGALDSYFRAVYYTRRGDNTQAIKYFVESTEQDSLFVPALSALAEAEDYPFEQHWDMNIRPVEHSESVAKFALTLDSTNALALAVLGSISLSLRADTTTAIDLFRKSLQHDENNTTALSRLGNLYLAKDPSEAVRFLARAHDANPSSFETTVMLGVALAKSKRRPESLQMLKLAVQDYPDRAFGWINLGYMYERNSNFDSALICYNTALRESRDEEDLRESYGNLATILLYKNELAKAESTLQKGSSALSRENACDIIYALGVTYERKGDNSKAIRTFQEGLRVTTELLGKEPIDPALFPTKALFLAKLGDKAKAISIAQKWESSDSLDAETAMRFARLFAVLGKKTEVIRWFRTAQSKDVEYDLPFLTTCIDLERYRDDPELKAVARGS